MEPRLARLATNLQERELSPVYLFTGEEDWLVKEAAGLVENAGLRGGLPEFNLSRFVVPETSMKDALADASTFPMMGGKRVVVIQCAQALDKAASAELEAYLDLGIQTTVLILILTKADARMKAIKRIKKEGVHIAFDALKGRDAVGWVVDAARTRGFGIDYGAANLLVDAVGADLRTLGTNLDKVIAFVGEERPIERGDVSQCVERTREEVIWDLTDALGTGNWRLAVTTLRGLLEAGQSPILVVAMIARHMRQIWKVKALAGQGMNPDTIAKTARIHPFVAKKLMGQVGRFSTDKLTRTMIRLFEADRSLKSSRVDGGTLLETIVLDLCRSNSVDRRNQPC